MARPCNQSGFDNSSLCHEERPKRPGRYNKKNCRLPLLILCTYKYPQRTQRKAKGKEIQFQQTGSCDIPKYRIHELTYLFQCLLYLAQIFATYIIECVHSVFSNRLGTLFISFNFLLSYS